MSIESDGRNLQVHLRAPTTGATVRLHDGDTLLWEGDVQDALRLELDLEEWQVAEPVRELLATTLPPLSSYSRAAFAPLNTPCIALATLSVEGPSGPARWSEPATLPGQLLPISMMAGVLHYSQSVFEGSKAFFVRSGGVDRARTFRADRNARRMWRSAERMGIPLDQAPGGRAEFLRLYAGLMERAIRANVDAGIFSDSFGPLDLSAPDFRWDKTPPSLYIRPILFATGPVLGVKPANHYTLAVYVTPVGEYRGDMVLRLERECPRAVPGGTGAAKASCNYAPTLPMMAALKKNRADATSEVTWTSIYDDILFIGRDEDIEEMGGANFFLLVREGGRLVLRTPPSIAEDPAADTILPGVTRDTVLEIGRALGLDVRVERIPLRWLTELSEAASRELAVFTTGTAAGIAPVVALLDGERTQRFAVWDNVNDPSRHRTLTADSAPDDSPLAAGRRIRSMLFRLQLGDEQGMRGVDPEATAKLLSRADEARWVQSFVL